MSTSTGGCEVSRGVVKGSSRPPGLTLRTTNVAPSKASLLSKALPRKSTQSTASSLWPKKTIKPPSKPRNFEVFVDENGEEELNVVKQLERLEKNIPPRVPLATIDDTRHNSVSSCEAKPKRGRSASPLVDDSVSEYGSALYEDSEYHSLPHSQYPSKSTDTPSLQLLSQMNTYMLERERRFLPRSDYIGKQPDLNENMRRVLVDWLSDVVLEFEMEPETLHLAVSLVDRLLSVCEVKRLQLQLLGTAALMVAAKYELIYPPELKDFVYVTDDSYTESQILKMERKLLCILSFDVSVPTSHWFVSHLLDIIGEDSRFRNLSFYLVDLALLGYEFVGIRPSVVAASALCLSSLIERKDCIGRVEELSGVKMNEMGECLELLLNSFHSASSSEQKSMYEKYCEEKFDEVAKLKAPLSLPF